MKWRSQGFLENTQRSLALFDTYGDGALIFDLGTAEYCRKANRSLLEYSKTLRKCKTLRPLVIVSCLSRSSNIGPLSEAWKQLCCASSHELCKLLQIHKWGGSKRAKSVLKLGETRAASGKRVKRQGNQYNP